MKKEIYANFTQIFSVLIFRVVEIMKQFRIVLKRNANELFR